MIMEDDNPRNHTNNVSTQLLNYIHNAGFVAVVVVAVSNII